MHYHITPRPRDTYIYPPLVRASVLDANRYTRSTPQALLVVVQFRDRAALRVFSTSLVNAKLSSPFFFFFLSFVSFPLLFSFYVLFVLIRSFIHSFIRSHICLLIIYSFICLFIYLFIYFFLFSSLSKESLRGLRCIFPDATPRRRQQSQGSPSIVSRI